MKTIYIVTEGTYSDYHIVCVFTDKVEAEKYLEELKQTSNDDPQIEEWPLDKNREYVARSMWTSKINLITGKLEQLHSRKVMAHPQTRVCEYNNKIENIPYATGYVPADLNMRSYVSQEHADKLAVELRQEFLRKIDFSLLQPYCGRPLEEGCEYYHKNYMHNHPDYDPNDPLNAKSVNI